jgi:hypothetical protein
MTGSNGPRGTRKVVYHVRVTRSEKGFIDLLRALAGMGRGDFIRSRCLAEPPEAASAADGEEYGRLAGFSETLNVFMKAANQDQGKRKAMVAGAYAALAEFDGNGGWPGGSPESGGRKAGGSAAAGGEGGGPASRPACGAAGPGAKPVFRARAGGRRAGKRRTSLNVSLPAFSADAGAFDAERAREEALAAVAAGRGLVGEMVAGGMSLAQVAESANLSLALKYGGGAVRVTAADVSKALGREPAPGPGSGPRKPAGGGGAAGPRASKVYLIVDGAEAAAVGRARKRAASTVADYARRCCLSGPPPAVPRENAEAYCRLSRLASNLTQLRNRLGRDGGPCPLIDAAHARLLAYRQGLMGVGRDS